MALGEEKKQAHGDGIHLTVLMDGFYYSAWRLHKTGWSRGRGRDVFHHDSPTPVIQILFGKDLHRFRHFWGCFSHFGLAV